MSGKCVRLLALMGACACLTSCALLPQEEAVRTAPVLREMQSEPYKIVKVQRGDLVKNEKITVRYVPVQKEGLSFKLLGEYVDRVMVNVGDFVQKGQLLAQLRVDDVEKRIAEAQAAAEELDLRMEYLEQEYALALRRHEIQAEGADPEAARKSLEELEEQFDERRESLQDQRSLQQLTLEDLNATLALRQIRAPFAGTVTYVRDYEEGHLSEYSETAVTIADSTVTVFRAETRNWAFFHEGDRYTADINKETHALEVVTEETLGIPVTEKTEGKKAYVYFRMTDPILGLEDGDYGVIDLELDRRENVLYVPNSSVITAGDIHLVYYQREDGMKGYKEIQTGTTIGNFTEITDGLTEGEEIIVS